MHTARIHLALLGLLSGLGLDFVSAGRRPIIARRDATCYFDIQAENGETCDIASSNWGISVEEFMKLNPGVICPNLQAGKSYCVVGEYEDNGKGQTTLPLPPKTTSSPTTNAPTTRPTTTRTSTTTSTTTAPNPSNSPAMPGIIRSCDRFYKVQSGDRCDSIAQKHSISVDQFKAWNTEINVSCSNLWADYYVCVWVPGATRPPTSTPTSTSPSNSPRMPGVVANCNRFYKIQSGDVCDTIARKNSITTAQLRSWNTNINPSCSNLWVDYYMCTGAATNPTTSAPSPSNSPALPGTVSNCNKWYKIRSGDTCDNIAAQNTITVAQFRSFNPQINSSTCLQSLLLVFWHDTSLTFLPHRLQQPLGKLFCLRR